MREHRNRRLLGHAAALMTGLVLMACNRTAPPVAATTAWAPPPDSLIPDDSLGAAIRRGQAILRDTRDSLPAYATSSLNCTSCHLGDGRQVGAASLIGVVARFPKYLGRAGAVIPIEDRINYCFTRSLAGRRLPNHSREMQDIVAYLAFLSQGLPVGTVPEGLGIPAIPVLQGDSARGHGLYDTTCAACHGATGGGDPAQRAPALWGAASDIVGLQPALCAAAALMLAGPLLARRYPLRMGEAHDVTQAVPWEDLFVAHEPNPEAGPVAVEIRYRVRPEDTDAFLDTIAELRAPRRRDGAAFWRVYHQQRLDAQPGHDADWEWVVTALARLTPTGNDPDRRSAHTVNSAV